MLVYFAAPSPSQVELGVAYAQKKLQHSNQVLVGVYTDTHLLFIAEKLNPMMFVSLDYIAATENQLLQTFVISIKAFGIANY